MFIYIAVAFLYLFRGAFPGLAPQLLRVLACIVLIGLAHMFINLLLIMETFSTGQRYIFTGKSVA